MLLVNPPSPPGTLSNKDTMGGLGQLYPLESQSKMPPLDILYCAAVLRQRGIPFEVVECLGLSLDTDQFLRRIRTYVADIVAIRTSLPTFDWDLEIAGLVKRNTDARIILFGPCTTYLYQEALQHYAIDGILFGEPELALAEIAAAGFATQHPYLLKKNHLSNIPPQATFVEDLDDLPIPAWDIMPYTAYSGTELMRNITPFVTMLASRGCVHGCLYCPYPITQGRKLRYHSVKRVVEQMKWLQNSLGVRAVLFRDPEFAIDRNRTSTLCEEMIAHNIKIAWRCETRIENLDPELVRIMSRAGCIGLNMGIESFDEGALSFLGRKPVSAAHAEMVISEARKAGISTFCFFILGLPGETIRSSLDTVSSAVALGCDHIQFTAATPYPGTRLYDWAIEKGYIENQSRSLLTGYDAVMQNGHLSSLDINDLRSFAGSKWAFTLMQKNRKSFDLMEFWRIWKFGLSIRLQHRRFLDKSQNLGE